MVGDDEVRIVLDDDDQLVVIGGILDRDRPLGRHVVKLDSGYWHFCEPGADDHADRIMPDEYGSLIDAVMALIEGEPATRRPSPT